MRRMTAGPLCLLLLPGCASVGSADVTIPFDDSDTQIVIGATIEGQSVKLMLDTAVDPSALDTSVADRLNLHRGKTVQVEGFGNADVQSHGSILPSLRIAGAEVGPLEVQVLDLSAVSAKLGFPLGGILGYSLLRKHAVLIDYPNRRLTLYRGGAIPKVPKCRLVHRFPLQWVPEAETIILVPGLTIGGIEVPARLDTGSALSLLIDADSAAVAPIRRLLPRGEASTAMGFRGSAPVSKGRLDAQVALGPFHPTGVPVALARGRRSAAPVNIGNGFLKTAGIRLLVDMPHATVAMMGECKKTD